MKLKLIKVLDLGVEYSIYILIFYIPISIAIVSIFGCIAFGLFLIKQFLSPDFSSIRFNKIFFFILLLFFIFMAASLINSGSLMDKSLKALVMKWGRFPLMLWMILDTFQDSRRIVIAAYVFSSSAALVGFSIFSQKFFVYEFLRHKPPSGVVTGPYPCRNDLASYLTCLIPVILSLSLWMWKRIYVKLGFFLITAMLILSSYWTQCRGGWIGLSAGLIWVFMLINYNRISKKIFWTMISLGYFFALPIIAMSLFLYKKDEARIILYRGAWKMITEHPYLGKGLGTFMSYCAQYTNDPWPAYAHNCFLQIWAESGIFSLLSFLLLNGYVLYKSIKVILRIPSSLNSMLLIGFSAGYLGLLIQCFFDTQLYSFQSSILFWVVLGLTVALSTNLNCSNQNKSCIIL